ncbi:Bacterial alpha-L-rhamnosidase [Paenibacillus sp. LMG 31461]|uniref:Bacterial alpha-L-rhamnosidase n=1 Tax=Paenibacillus plantarum TaxID=2654975 RepID=A0ABX1XG95_9BACL|nr:sugar hydrolase [Paenibacillus plantarum]NOU67527.1 Bacterial alpha-L-rhamnosidase [Paenibacillus plantarum]
MGRIQRFVDKADQLTPTLIQSTVYPKQMIEVIQDSEAFQGWNARGIGSVDTLQQQAFGKDESFILDFGDHQVGYLTLSIKPVGSPPDAPLRLKLIFGEMPCEIGESFDDYEGWLSRSWLQDEIINIDILPCEIKLPRRYSFRYLKVTVVATSVKYKVAFEDIHCTTVTSGDLSIIPSLPETLTDDLKVMDRIGIKTLQDCMQTVFEDGPKRDRRLWIGDLRLQAQANYLTFQNYDLVKRCLYLFGGMTLEGGEVGACLFEKPEPHVDDTLLYDYSLFFVATLCDYYMASRDRETLIDLWPIAMDQIKIAVRRLDDRGIVKDDPSWWCFTDWQPELNKQGSAQAILIYCLKRGLILAEELSLADSAVLITEYISLSTEGALKHLWCEEKGFFVSGSEEQVSWATQIWMVLAEVRDAKANANLLEKLFNENPDIGLSTPYSYHHLIEALIQSGLRDKALEQLRAYWGEMVKDGADCFWELYNPMDKRLSPYGSNLINSYCHAWSCTPTYFIRKYY